MLPFWAGADHHDYHHKAFTSNFASSFRHWDWLLSTDTAYHAYRARIAKAGGKEERRRVQEKEDERTLREGEREAKETERRG